MWDVKNINHTSSWIYNWCIWKNVWQSKFGKNQKHQNNSKNKKNNNKNKNNNNNNKPNKHYINNNDILDLDTLEKQSKNFKKLLKHNEFMHMKLILLTRKREKEKDKNKIREETSLFMYYQFKF